MPAVDRVSVPLTMDREHSSRAQFSAPDPSDVSSRVLAVTADLVPIDDFGGLIWVQPEQLHSDPQYWAHLGRFADGQHGVAAVYPPGTMPFDAQWLPIRTVAASLPADAAAAAVSAVSIGAWLISAPFCAACSGQTTVQGGGWSRLCQNCGTEHFPRIDPAVIVAVESKTKPLLLLGTNAAWRDRNLYSCFAGFVEAGESLEDAVIREVREEAGVALTGIRYQESQAWPYPRSLMIGFRAQATDDAAAAADGKEIVAVRWFSREQIRAGLRGEGEVQLPGPSSVAHRLIIRWLDGAL